MKKTLQKGNIVYATGIYLEWNGEWWEVPKPCGDFPYDTPFQDDTYHEGNLVNDIENKPYTEGE